MSDTFLNVEGLQAFYGSTQVLHGIDFAVERGAVTVILGPNGAGKTTTLRAVCNMVRARGKVTFAGERIEGRGTEEIVRMGIAHVPSDRGTFMQLTAEENLRLGAYSRSDRRAVAADLESVYGYFPRLRERSSQQAGTLSGGEQQMLAISRALMLRPKLMLLDEPSFGLAPLVVRDIYAILREIRTREGLSILLVEQNAAISLEFADQAYVLESGRVALSGPADELKRDDAVRQAYVGEVKRT